MTSGLQHPPKSECFLSRCHLKRKVCFLDSPAVAEWQGLFPPGQEASSFRKECVIYCCTASAASFAFEIFWGGKSKGRCIHQAHVLLVAPRKAGEWVSSSTHFSYRCFADQPHLKRSKKLGHAWPWVPLCIVIVEGVPIQYCRIRGRVLHLLTGWVYSVCLVESIRFIIRYGRCPGLCSGFHFLASDLL